MTTIETIKSDELNECELDNVSGGGLLKFIKAIAYSGHTDQSDPDLSTHPQLWVVSAS